jgi:hypothetical protein
MTRLMDLVPAAEQGWLTLFELAQENDSDWLLVGGQMVYLLALEHGTHLPRATVDMDVVINVRTRPGGTAWFSTWSMSRGFKQVTPSTDGIGLRFTRAVDEGLGTLIFDVLAPEGLGSTTDLTTVPPARTVQAPGATQAFSRSNLVDVEVRFADGQAIAGRIRRPELLGALVLKVLPRVRSQCVRIQNETGKTVPYC